MVQYITKWFKQYFANTEIAVFWLFSLFVVLAFVFFGKMLAPVLASIVLAYLLQGLVGRLERWKVPHWLAVTLAFSLFIGCVVIALLGLLPLLWRQLSNMVNQLPGALDKSQAFFASLPLRYPQYVSTDQVQQGIVEFKTSLTHISQSVLSASLSSIPDIIVVTVYLVLVPLLVYFFLMDRIRILHWFERFLPKNRHLIDKIWHEVYGQIGNYVRGKALEMFIVWIVCYIVFILMGLQYAMLLSVLVGVSVIIPYIGAVLVTVPVLIVAFLQWGWGVDFAYLMLAYGIIIALDANILVPLLFSEAVDLHPVAIIIAVLIFGGLWGFWGVFFAIPLATLVKAIINGLSSKKRLTP